MDLNPREAVVAKKPLRAPEPEKGEVETNALIVPENVAPAAILNLNHLAAAPGAINIVRGSRCYRTARPPGDFHCGDR